MTYDLNYKPKDKEGLPKHVDLGTYITAEKYEELKRDKTELEELVGRAVRNAGPHRMLNAPRWGWVRDTLGVGSTRAKKLCTIFGLDPDELLVDTRCAECELLQDDAESGEFE